MMRNLVKPANTPMPQPYKVPVGVCFLSWALLAPNPVRAQARTFDEGVLRVTISGTDVAREEFSILQGRSFDGGTGFRLLATAFYPPRRTRVTIPSWVDVGSDSLPRLAQFGPNTGDDLVTQARFGPRIFILKTQRPSTGETFREYPGVSRNWVVDDSLLSLYALPPRTDAGTVRLVSPRDGGRVDFQLTDRGLEDTLIGTRRWSLRHLVLTAAPDVRHLWYDAGRLMKVEIPARQLVAVREVGSAIPNR